MYHPEEDRDFIQVVESITPAVVPEGFIKKGLEISVSDDQQPQEAEPKGE